MTLWQRQENFVCNRRFPFLPYCCVHSLIATNRITKPFMTLWQLQEYLVRNRTFLFLPYYCVHSPIATNRITMRFAVRSAPPFRYRTKRTNYSKGGIWSGTLPPSLRIRRIWERWLLRRLQEPAVIARSGRTEQ